MESARPQSRRGRILTTMFSGKATSAAEPIAEDSGGCPAGIDRRRFLRGVSACAAAAVLSRFAAPIRAADPADWTMRLATSSIHYLHQTVEQACEQIASLGFEAVDIWSAHAGCPHLDDVADRLGAAGLSRLLEAQKLKLSAFSVYSGGYAKYAELLGQVGGGVAVRGSAPPCTPSELTARMRQFLEGLKPEIDLAERHQSYLAIENHGNALLDSLDSFKAFVELNRSPRVGIALAPYHLQASGVPVEEVIGISGRQLLFFYAWQHADGVGQLPGHGPTDFTGWIAALAQAGFRGYVNPFMHGDLPPAEMTAALKTSREYLLSCAAKAGVATQR